MAATIVQGYPPDVWGQIVNDIAGKDPELSGMVAAYLEEMKGQAGMEEEPVEEVAPGGAQENPIQQIAQSSMEPDKGVPRSQQKL